MEAKNEDGRLDQDLVGRSVPTPILDSMNGSDFVLSAAHAEKQAVDAVATRDDILTWVERLQPYFDRYPAMTVSEALQLYFKDHPRKTPCNEKPTGA